MPLRNLSPLAKLMFLVAAALLALGLVVLLAGAYTRSQQADGAQDDGQAAASPRDATYIIDDEPAVLVDGSAEMPPAPGAMTPTVVTMFSVAAQGDLDGDGVDDAAVLLVKESGGSGTFFYVAGALKRGNGYQGTNAVLLGDRIAPNTTNIRDGVLVHDYATRNPGEPMTARPSVGASIFLRYVDGALRETADRPQP